MLILDYDSTEIVPGGAGNAAKNVAALGGAPSAIGVVGRGRDRAARLLEALRRRVDVRGVVQPRGYRTPTKTRILAGGVHSAKQQVVRIDRAARPELSDGRPPGDRAQAGVRPRRAATRCWCPTTAPGWSRRPLVARARRARFAGPGRRAPVLVDSRYALLRFRGMTACTPNESEVEQIFGVRIGDEPARAREGRPRAARATTQAGAVLITRGSRGMALFEPGRPTVHIPIFGSDQIADVTGAGDTVIATMTLALAAGGDVRARRRGWRTTPAGWS